MARPRRAAILASLIVWLVIVVVQAQAPVVTYVYDELGRLVAVIDPSGAAAIYTYDAVGNLLSIIRQNPGVVSIIEFTPDSGPAGTSVTIYGTGFSAVAAENTVTFNGIAAAVMAATTTRITTTVPAAATTGPIGVAAPGGSATSGTAFIVASSQAPTVASFAPTMGTPGTAVTVTGTNYQTVLSDNDLRFNITRGQVAVATPTTLSTSVPSNTGSGRISVRTLYGAGVSAVDFYIPPPPYTAADVEFTGRMNVGESRTVTLATAGKIGLLLFDGTAGQRVSLNMTSVTITSGSVYLRKPDGTTLASGSFFNSVGFLDGTLPTTGTYTLLIDPNSTYTGSITLTLDNVPPDLTGTIAPGGAEVTVTTTTPGQNAILSFAGTLGQRVSLNMTSVTITSGSVYLRKPDGTTLASRSFNTGGGFLDVQTLPTTDTYTLLIDPSSSYTGSITLTLYNVPPDLTGTIAPGGAEVTVTTTTPGQNAILSFAGTLGQRVSLNMTSVTIASGSVYLRKPDGTTLASRSFSTSAEFLDVQTLPTTGTYTLLIDPSSAFTGSITLTLYNVPPDETGGVTIGGPAATVTTTTPGQNARLTFDGTSAQQVTVRATDSTMGCVTVKLLKPDQTQLTSRFTCSSSFNLSPQTLPATDTYTISIDPFGTNVGSISVSVTSP